MPEELPTWFLEALYDKPIDMIFEDLEQMNKEEFSQIRRKLRKKGNDLKGNNHNNIHTIYNKMKNNNLELLDKKVRYFFIRSSSFEKIQVFMN